MQKPNCAVGLFIIPIPLQDAVVVSAGHRLRMGELVIQDFATVTRGDLRTDIGPLGTIDAVLDDEIFGILFSYCRPLQQSAGIGSRCCETMPTQGQSSQGFTNKNTLVSGWTIT